MDKNNSNRFFILGHSIKFESLECTFTPNIDLDDELYDISQDILDGFEYGKIFIASINMRCLWNIED
ncbi:MAG: hypothetical protein COB17_03095 [Sulfurimonas sp.]|nr:MAG: hypothetical protein COB17_03095 [Sulfurimonas sp.]